MAQGQHAVQHIPTHPKMHSWTCGAGPRLLTVGTRPPQVLGLSQRFRPLCWKGQLLRCSCRVYMGRQGTAGVHALRGRAGGAGNMSGRGRGARQAQASRPRKPGSPALSLPFMEGTCGHDQSCLCCRIATSEHSRCRWHGSVRGMTWAGRWGWGSCWGLCPWPAQRPRWPCTPPQRRRCHNLRGGSAGGGWG